MSAFKVFDFSFCEGYWLRSFRVTVKSERDDIVHSWETKSVKVSNNGVPHTCVDEEELDGVEEHLIWAFENRKRRNDSRDVCSEVDIESLLPPE